MYVSVKAITFKVTNKIRKKLLIFLKSTLSKSDKDNKDIIYINIR